MDIENIWKSIGLTKNNVKNLSGNGFQKLKTLYKKVNKIYVKGASVEPFVYKLNIEKICKLQCDIYCKLCIVLLGNSGCKN